MRLAAGQGSASVRATLWAMAVTTGVSPAKMPRTASRTTRCKRRSGNRAVMGARKVVKLCSSSGTGKLSSTSRISTLSMAPSPVVKGGRQHSLYHMATELCVLLTDVGNHQEHEDVAR